MALEQGTLFDGEEQGRKNPLTIEQIIEIAGLYTNGALVSRLAKHFRVTFSTIYHALARCGVKLRKNCPRKDDKEKIVSLYQQGRSSCSIADQLRMSESTVLRTLHSAGIKVKNQRYRFDDQGRQEMADAYAKGESSFAIAKRCNTTRRVVCDAIVACGGQIRHPNADVPNHMKRCPRCKEVKKRSEGFFSSKKFTPSYCKTCFTDYGREAGKKQNAKTSAKLRSEVISAYGGECQCCGEKIAAFLTIDHIGGGGSRHRRELGKKGKSFYRWLKAQGWPKEGYRLLCMNCNWATRLGQPCPHKTSIILPDR